jgi:hypothetical protein
MRLGAGWRSSEHRLEDLGGVVTGTACELGPDLRSVAAPPHICGLQLGSVVVDDVHVFLEIEDRVTLA